MNLIFIYGPPASGKLTVAKELSKITGYKVFHNHTFVASIGEIFSPRNKELNKIRRDLSRKMRLKIFKEAAKANVSFITTFGMAGTKYFDFFRSVKKVTEKHKGRVLFVQLLPSKGALLSRVKESSRKGAKIDSKEFLEKKISEQPEIFNKFPDTEHLTIDNTNLSVKESAKRIISHYKL